MCNGYTLYTVYFLLYAVVISLYVQNFYHYTGVCSDFFIISGVFNLLLYDVLPLLHKLLSLFEVLLSFIGGAFIMMMRFKF